MKKLLFIMLFSAMPLLAAEKYSCDEGRGKYCKHMSSCAEAKYYLNKCGIGRLDRDNDGIPCENVCRK
ncbi:Excalibur calcium-binding domain-containing protein [Pasteurella testudinis DSM 23072]|uniref:Excalibur calcium-binding domain-containing protein n=1 Tax=Pasteurella testudinis DSM 23072 TaxID=1122938 RepID=A0A1W1UNI9_9PAST|nr:excalibur calcium-binding domain-containing protein [Pasteurella testudinis]SMB82371.1 Excalibur calcium-binding domain-containing protein [Pasteurella testudinis DSM 23072]SUB52231.1 Excalibur calcium-binding domain [Pasteurella testudinis]